MELCREGSIKELRLRNEQINPVGKNDEHCSSEAICSQIYGHDDSSFEALLKRKSSHIKTIIEVNQSFFNFHSFPIAGWRSALGNF